MDRSSQDVVRNKFERESSPVIGDRINGKYAPPDEKAVRDWIGPQAFESWIFLCDWIAQSYPGVFEPDWVYGGAKRGWGLRFKKTKAFCTLLPGYQSLCVQVVLGRTEREKFEERRYMWRPELVKLYDESRTYIDGKWLIIKISSADDLEELIQLISMKRQPALSI